MRLFVAVNFDEEAKDRLENAITDLKAAAVSGNFTLRENLHLTLAFIGETDRADAAKRALDAVKAAPFDFRISGIGWFERRGEYLYWAGTQDVPPLLALRRKVCAALAAQGFDIEDRKFKAHVTLGRRVIVPDGFDAGCVRAPDAAVRVDRIGLMQSERVDGRLKYTRIYEKPLTLRETDEYAGPRG